MHMINMYIIQYTDLYRLLITEVIYYFQVSLDMGVDDVLEDPVGESSGDVRC